MRLAARAGERLRLERQHAQVVRDAPGGEERIEPCRELVVLRRDAGGVAPGLVVVVVAGCASDLPVLVVQLRAVVAHRDQRRRPDRHRVGT